jgi:hypothetical protein
MNQNYANQNQPQKDLWICEFCEYEAIFGAPPRALIRQYEVKAHTQQKLQQERQRMLEKVRQKARKAKKNAKTSAHKQFVHQAAEFQKKEFIRNTGGAPGASAASAANPGQHDGTARPPGQDDYLFDDRYDDGGGIGEGNFADIVENFRDDDDVDDVPPPIPPRARAGPSVVRRGTTAHLHFPPPPAEIGGQ